MCGIVGCILKRGRVAPLLHESLKRLEYRGYDSAGIATISEGKIFIKKDKGKIDDIHKELNLDDMPGNIGIGHCLHPDTYILTANGDVRKIKELPEICELLAYDFKNNKFVKAIGRVFKHRANKLLRIRTASTEIETTEYHKFYVFNSEKEQVIEKLARDLKKDDLLILPQEIKIRGSPKELKNIPIRIYYKPTEEGWALLQKLINKEENKAKLSRGLLSHIRRKSGNISIRVLQILNINPKEKYFKPINSVTSYIKFPNKTSPKLMRLLGYYFGDGSSNERSIKFKDKNIEILREYNKLIKELFLLEGKIVKGGKNYYVLKVNSVYLKKWLKKNFPDLMNKHFPHELGKLTDEEICAFIGGLFDAEGGVGKKAKSVFIGMSDVDAIRQLQIHLLRIGILASISYGSIDETGGSRPARLQIANKEYIGKFIDKVGKYISRSKLTEIEYVYNQLQGYAFNHIKIPVKKSVLYKKFHVKNIRGNGFLTLSTLTKVNNNDLIKYISKYLEAPIIYQKVYKIEEVNYDGYVYDIEVEKYGNFVANAIIQHNSRWATHGAPEKINAHPHTDCKGIVAVVHNGVIENFLELKQELIDRGHKFVSRTDTEVIPHLIEEELDKGENLYNAVLNSVRKLKGSFALAIISKVEPDKIICVRNESPLILGVSDDGLYCASDIPAILPYTNKIVSLKNGEIAILTKKSFEIRKIKDDSIVSREIQFINWTIEMAEKQGYPHFMLKEIHEQPISLRNALRLQEQYLNLISMFLDRGREIFLVAAGTSYHACLAASYMFSKLAKLATYPVIASEFIERYGDAIGIDSVILAVSQSGETYDVLNAVDYARMRAATVIGITNTVGSTLTRVSRAYIVQQSGPEIGVAATKTFTAQLIVLAQLALKLAKLRGKISQDEIDELNMKLHQMPDIIQKILREREDRVREIAKKYAHKKLFVFLGRGINTATAYEGRLKLLEISYIPSLAYSAAESKHGPIAIIEEGTPTIFIAPNDETRKDILGNIMEMKARGATIISICEEGDKEIIELSNDFIELPSGIPGILTPIPYIIPLQLFAYYVAVERGLDPDKPRNLAKSVTVP